MYVQRDLQDIFKKVDKEYGLIALVGARQAGKTTFLKHHMPGDASYVLFDDPDARDMFDEDVKKFEIQYMQGNDLTILDEVQYCKDAGSKLKYLVDSGNKMWITSSSETVLRKEILSFLVGRVSIQRLYPFSIREFLRAKGQKQTTPAILDRMVWEHIKYGGYPKVVLTSEPDMKRVILQDLLETLLLKDVAKTFNIDDLESLERLARYLSLNAGGQLSYDHIASTLDISFVTVKKYLTAFEKSYMIKMIKPFFTNKTKELVKQPKVYFLDTGMLNTVARTFPDEPDGKVFENYVVSEIVKMGYEPKYWRTKSKAEVDVIIEKGNKIIPIEIKLKANPGKVERSLRSFIDSYGPSQAFVVYYNGEAGERNSNGCKILFTDILGLWDRIG